VILAQSFIAITVLLRISKAAFESVNPGLGAVASTLGLTPWWVFVSIDLPLAARGIAAA
jgi:molybdate transport system permease protein